MIDEFISDEHNLQNTAALVFVFIDTASDPEFNRDLSTFERVAKHVSDVSPNSKVDCVVIKNATKVDENSQVESVSIFVVKTLQCAFVIPKAIPANMI